MPGSCTGQQHFYAREAVAALKKALEKGFADAAVVRADDVFATLRMREDCQDVIRRLTTKDQTERSCQPAAQARETFLAIVASCLPDRQIRLALTVR